ncbi:chloride channel protein [Thalassotalea atypica]|uniref:chloride channel protein n=1 Tax=Thalassotalea atypica TaxID=2054316 RepID=UPI00257327AE|nr:chloride channel protein [Thalassotalea atypica]
MKLTSLKRFVEQYSLDARIKLGQPKTSWQLCLLAIIGGVCSASLIVLFTWCINSIQGLFLEDVDNYNSLNASSRLLLPIGGAVIILLFARMTGYQYTRTGIPFVLHRLKVAYGVIPLRNTVNQFFGGMVALASGFSVGKEGPAVHLGAAISGYIGKALVLPYNSVRTLCACGVAAGIAACFNTPIAAVVFVMEVVLREYKVHMFIPIMLAAIIGSMMTSSIFGFSHEFEFFSRISLETAHYPVLLIFGVVLGTLASLFNRYIVMIIEHFQHVHIFKRFMSVAIITGIIGVMLPQALGTDLGAISVSLSNEWHFSLLFALLISKCLLTIVAIGCGIPGGIIGPILGIGAIAGAFTASMISGFVPGENLTSDFALMGMAGFMAATLNAPLAALLAVVELSHQLDIMLPAMIVISASCLAAGQFFNNRSVFVMQLNVQNLAYRKPPLENTLQRIGVLGMMDSSFDMICSAQKEPNIKGNETTGKPLIMRKSVEEQNEYYWNEEIKSEGEERRIRQHKLIPITSKETLAEAYWLLKESRCGGVYIYDTDPNQILGIITFDRIRTYLIEGKLY